MRMIKKGMIFELVEPERIWTINNEEFKTPPETVGIVRRPDLS